VCGNSFYLRSLAKLFCHFPVVGLFCGWNGWGLSFCCGYLHLSDAILVTTGQPSRGRRRLAVRLVYFHFCHFYSFAGLWLPAWSIGDDRAASAAPSAHDLDRNLHGLHIIIMWLPGSISGVPSAGLSHDRGAAACFICWLERPHRRLAASHTSVCSGLAANFPFLFWGLATATNFAGGGPDSY